VSHDAWAPPRAILTPAWLETQLRAEDASAVARDERALFDKLAGGPDADLILFGAGNLGRQTAAGLTRAGIRPLALADNERSLQGTHVDGLPVLSPEDAAARYGDDAVFVVTIWAPFGPLAYPSVAKQMRALGCSRTVPFVPLFWKYQEEFLPNFLLDAPHRLYLDADQVRAAYASLADDTSRTEYLTQLSYLLSSMDELEVTAAPEQEQYFPRDLVHLSAQEVFVDCGAYDGDTVESFLEACGSRFGAIVAFEPDPEAIDGLRTLVRESLPQLGDRIRVEQKAVGAIAGQLRFEGGGTPVSRIAESGTLVVDCVTLDAALVDLAPTFIKMDIEGAEEDALLGATETIRAHRPVLAVCVYHVQAHLYRLPLLIGRLCADYTLFLRRRGPDGDLVCFAIPNERRRLGRGT
jgi:FkbM family methyltransferase